MIGSASYCVATTPLFLQLFAGLGRGSTSFCLATPPLLFLVKA